MCETSGVGGILTWVLMVSIMSTGIAFAFFASTPMIGLVLLGVDLFLMVIVAVAQGTDVWCE